MKTRKIIRCILKPTIFLLILTFIFLSIQTALVGNPDSRDSERITGFFELPDESLDVVFLGSSATYAFWNAPVAWAEYGITAYPLSNSAQPSFAAKFLIEDAKKHHPDALYIINVTHLLERYDPYIDNLLTNYPLSLNKIRMTNYLCKQAGFSLVKTLGMHFPVFRYKERWSQLRLSDFEKKPDAYMGGSRYDVFLNQSKDVSGFKPDFTIKAELKEYEIQGMNDLIDYCEQENVNVLFVIMPQAVGENRLKKQNAVAEILESRGMNFLDLRKYADEMGMDYKVDYYNERHTNLHGSIKVTDYLARYLVENHGFKDKRGQEEYQNWQIATDKYFKLIRPYLIESDYKYLNYAYQ